MSYSADPSPPRVLVVDDHTPSRMTAVALLSVDGYQVEQADCGHSALSRVEAHPPDLIVLDVMMPGIDGFEVCRRLKRNDSTRLIPIIFVTALEDREARLKGIEAGGDDFITKPFDALELSARVKSLIHQKRLNEDLDHAEQVLFSIARTVESRDPNTGDHCERLVKSAQAFGEYLQLAPNHVRHLTWAGYLHDIGKVGIPDAILLKTGPLTPEDRAIMERHAVIGEAICQPLRTMRGVIPIIRHHHERWDGSGYPDGLAGDAIPRLAQIFQILDIFDALTHARPYKPAFSVEDSLTILAEEVARGWRDPILVAQFYAFLGRQPNVYPLEASLRTVTQRLKT
ncbi:HD domain-containing phosphohydrolase [Phormidium sp. FACHB-1136]|uniref:HD domain-containing phosphohydrolase n=1 Tax=Phormidium sp. FACHB-1136 TaxID=2692848 RepID=UPI001687A659|nr:HD domain-containing phosphohydrolase [Phormidium sp. FACHB-1136]MBD2428478.1 response regulator [Phormidium sp. FACHB-1136]